MVRTPARHKVANKAIDAFKARRKGNKVNIKGACSLQMIGLLPQDEFPRSDHNQVT